MPQTPTRRQVEIFPSSVHKRTPQMPKLLKKIDYPLQRQLSLENKMYEEGEKEHWELIGGIWPQNRHPHNSGGLISVRYLNWFD